jgi:putative inorganic carbon (hco3(-)) transporter
MSSSLLLVCIFLGGVVAVVGLLRPFLGFLVFLVIHFIQPGELVPALAPLRLELVYGVLLIAIVIFSQKGGVTSKQLFADHIIFSGFLLVGIGILSIPFAIWRGGAAETVIEMFKLITIVVLMKLMVDTTDRLRKLLWCLAAIGAWIAVSSLLAFSAGAYYELSYNAGNLNRAEGINSIVAGPNELAGFLLALIPLSVALFRTTSNFKARLFLLVAGALSLIAIVLAGSRIAFVGLLVIGVCFIFQSKNRSIATVLCAVLVLSLWMGMPEEYKKRYSTMEDYAVGGQLDDSNALRIQVWKAGWQIFMHDPIFGVGAGQFSTAYGLLTLKGEHKRWMQPHNLIIQTACELGILGLIALANFLVQIAKGIGAVLRKKGKRGVEFNYQVAVASAVMFVGVLLISAFGHTLYRPYWYLLGGLVSATQGTIAARGRKVSEIRRPYLRARGDKNALAGHRLAGLRLSRAPVREV